MFRFLGLYGFGLWGTFNAPVEGDADVEFQGHNPAHKAMNSALMFLT